MAANDDDMHSRIQSLPAMQRSWEPTLQLPPRLGMADSGSMEALEELVSAALTSAQDAETLSQAAYDTSRRARRGVMVGVALAMLGVVVAVAGSMGGRLFHTQGDTADLADRMQALSTLQHRISDQLAALQAQDVARQNGIRPAAQLPTPAPATQPSHAKLPPLSTVTVGVLPAHVAVQDDRPDGKPPTDTSRVSWVAPASTGTVADPASFPTPPPPVWHEPAPPPRPSYQIVMPWPAVYVIGKVRRDVHILFR